MENDSTQQNRQSSLVLTLSSADQNPALKSTKLKLLSLCSMAISCLIEFTPSAADIVLDLTSDVSTNSADWTHFLQPSFAQVLGGIWPMTAANPLSYRSFVTCTEVCMNLLMPEVKF